MRINHLAWMGLGEKSETNATVLTVAVSLLGGMPPSFVMQIVTYFFPTAGQPQGFSFLLR